MEVVEIVGMEKRLDLAIFVLLCASILVAVGLNDRAMPLILTQQHEMLLTDTVKRLTIWMPHQQLASLCADVHLDQSSFCVQHKNNPAWQQSQVEVYDVAESSVYFETAGGEAFDQFYLFSLCVESIMGESFKAFSCIKLQIFASLHKMDDGGRLREGVIFVVDLVEQVCSIFVENNQKGSSFQLVEPELVMSLQILQKVLIAQLETIARFLHDHNDIWRKENHKISLKDQDIPVFETVWTSQLLQDADVRAFILN